MSYLTYNSASNRYPIRGFSNPNAVKSPDAAGDPFFDNVVLFLKGDGVNNSNVFVDSSLEGQTLISSGAPVISTAQSKYGGSSIYFNGSSSLEVIAANDFSFPGDFAVECVYYPTVTTADTALLTINNYTNGMLFRARSAAGLIYAQGQIPLPASSPAINTWHHIALTRSGTTMRGFINGALGGTVTVSGTVNTSTSSIKIGIPYGGNASVNYIGYIDSLRVTKGVARYIANFNPETDTFLE